MSDAKELGITPASAGTGTGAVSLGKGAWDCDANREIPPDKEVRCLGHTRTRPNGCLCGRTATRKLDWTVMPIGAAMRAQGHPRFCPLPVGVTDATPSCPPPCSQAEVFEEIATLEFQFEGIPTVPPRKDMEHFAFFCDGCRYRYVPWNA
jgi:hypothetical protein